MRPFKPSEAIYREFEKTNGTSVNHSNRIFRVVAFRILASPSATTTTSHVVVILGF
jgi:hypothetical protein